MTILNEPTLVLNKHWAVIGHDNVRESINKLMRGSCRFLNHNTNELFTFEQWSETEPLPGFEVVHSARRAYFAPEIVVLSNYHDMPKNQVRLCAHQLLVRDNFSCQYCGCKVVRPSSNAKERKLMDYTMDHVVPKSHGGKKSWENLVTACWRCNSKKADRTPQKAGMHLRSVPVKPKGINEVLKYIKYMKNKKPSWKHYLTEDLWNVEAVGAEVKSA